MSKFIAKHWGIVWKSYVALVIIGIVLTVFGLSVGLFLVFFPTFLILAAYYFKTLV